MYRLIWFDNFCRFIEIPFIEPPHSLSQHEWTFIPYKLFFSWQEMAHHWGFAIPNIVEHLSVIHEVGEADCHPTHSAMERTKQQGTAVKKNLLLASRDSKTGMAS